MEAMNGGAIGAEVRLAALRELLEGVLPGCTSDPLVPELDLTGDLGLDSLDLVEVAAGIEERFGVEIDLDERGELRTVADLLERITRPR